MTQTVQHTGIFLLASLFATLLLWPGTASGMPPHPSLLDESAAAKRQGEVVIPSSEDLHARGICTPGDFFGNRLSAIRGGKPVVGSVISTYRILAVLVQFSDHPSSVNAAFFDSLVFDTAGRTVKDYFAEVSYGAIDLITTNLPSSLGWRTAPSTYAYYVNGQQGTGQYPQNSQKLVEDIVDQIDTLVNFADYDNDGDGYVDVLLVIHSGTGAEFSGSADDIWSHKWAITPRLKDGVYISDYTIQPEFWVSPGDMTIGVYSHELCHGFGLPDLYDTDGSSNGIGRWGIMATGSWNGPSNFGESPAHPCAWSRIQMGITTPVNVTTNALGQSINAVENGGSIFRLWTSGGASSEYFLVENRQKVGYDLYLPGAGLLIWHIDDTKTDNTEEWYPGLNGAAHYLAALEQADGLFELEHRNDYGDAADPFPGTLNRTSFTGTTSPNSDSYSGSNTFVEVTNISASSLSMTADLIVGIAATINDDQSGTLPVSPELAQNYPNPFNPSTTIQFELGQAADITLEVINTLGQRVRTLADGTYQSGRHTVTWDATDDHGQTVASGVYLYRLVEHETGEEVTRKMVLVR